MHICKKKKVFKTKIVHARNHSGIVSVGFKFAAVHSLKKKTNLDRNDPAIYRPLTLAPFKNTETLNRFLTISIHQTAPSHFNLILIKSGPSTTIVQLMS